jgi:hypothetical protein
MTPCSKEPAKDALANLKEEDLKVLLLREDILLRRRSGGKLERFAAPISGIFSAFGAVLALLVTLAVARSNSAMRQLEFVEKKIEAKKLQEDVEKRRSELQGLDAQRAKLVDDVNRLNAQRESVALNAAARMNATSSGRGASISLSPAPYNGVTVAVDSHPQGAKVTAFLDCNGVFSFPDQLPRDRDCTGKGNANGGNCGATPCSLGTFSRMAGQVWVRIDFGEEVVWRHLTISPR